MTAEDRITVFAHEKMSVWCYPTRKLIHHEMHKPTAGDVFRSALLAGLEAMRKYQADRWLSDDRQHTALAPEDEDWAQEVWFPQAKEAGWRHWAVMQPQSAVGSLSSARFRKWYAERGVNAQLFTDIEEAHRWLDAQ